jgi:nitrogen fixation/metabolism regulation signal transduction histidine kinase
MSIKTRLIIYFSLIFILLSTVSIFSFYKNYSGDVSFKAEISESIKLINNASKQATIAQLVRYDDEVLSQSARNYAFTGEVKWKDRYNEFVPKLDLRIKEALQFGDEKDNEIFDSINGSNQALIALEKKAMGLADKGELASAQYILNSQEYSNQKAVYKTGIDNYLARHGISIDNADPISTTFLSQSQAHFSNLSMTQTYLFLILILLFIIIIVFLFWIIASIFMKPIIILKETAQRIIKGDLSARVEIKNKDEIGEFAASFNEMTSKLNETLQITEQKVKDRTAELEQLQNRTKGSLGEAQRLIKLMVGRELEMIKLKEELANLKRKN